VGCAEHAAQKQGPGEAQAPPSKEERASSKGTGAKTRSRVRGTAPASRCRAQVARAKLASAPGGKRAAGGAGGAGGADEQGGGAGAQGMLGAETRERKFWAQWRALLRFRMDHGHCSVPFRAAGRLRARGNFVHNARSRLRRGGALAPRRRRALEALGFGQSCAPRQRRGQQAWEARFGELLRFRQTHGRAAVPHQACGRALGRWGELSLWIAAQQRRMPALDPARRARLAVRPRPAPPAPAPVPRPARAPPRLSGAGARGGARDSQLEGVQNSSHDELAWEARCRPAARRPPPAARRF
jgi:hypothetical protein